MRKATAAVSGVLTLLAALLIAAAPAQSDTPLTVCTGTATVDYSPPLGPLPRQTRQSVTEKLGTDGGGSCTGPFTTGTATTVFDQQVSCLAQGLGDTLVQNVVTYHWQGGQTSTITYPLTTVVHAANQEIVTSTGTVTAGYALGALSERVAVYPSLSILDCLNSTITQQTGQLTLTLT
ncbi:hypothetical protein GTY65_39965 [Streptomyces sp. SID8379]|uniref:hypothetical protein n=1 Tax=unclassified Streptomyces TaxID=2593676 RepID=UPI00036AD1F7|nr:MULTISPECIES: hypothetical protein [unclassified Streptomyces]MYW70186.1 hypothetical protein [Streptomyces sp. SID8379]